MNHWVIGLASLRQSCKQRVPPEIPLRQVGRGPDGRKLVIKLLSHLTIAPTVPLVQLCSNQASIAVWPRSTGLSCIQRRCVDIHFLMFAQRSGPISKPSLCAPFRRSRSRHSLRCTSIWLGEFLLLILSKLWSTQTWYSCRR